MTFTAANALTGSATTVDHGLPGSGDPRWSRLPATASGDENTLITFTVTAVDSDGDAITSLTAAPLPAGATFTANAAEHLGHVQLDAVLHASGRATA